MLLFNKHLNIDFRNGVGFDLEFADSKPVWVYNVYTDETTAMPFEGVVVLLPFVLISYGMVYDYE